MDFLVPLLRVTIRATVNEKVGADLRETAAVYLLSVCVAAHPSALYEQGVEKRIARDDMNAAPRPSAQQSLTSEARDCSSAYG